MSKEMFQYVTPSEVIEYLFCPRFIYFMNTLKIEQHEDRRRLVTKGREMHKLKLINNKDYIRKQIGCIDKETDVYLSSDKLKLVGIVDEVLTLSNEERAPLDYKFSVWENKIYTTYKTQQILYALLIEDVYHCKVNKGYLVYVRSKNHLEEFPISLKQKEKAISIVNEIFDILNLNFFPKGTSQKRKCEDCTYRNIC